MGQSFSKNKLLEAISQGEDDVVQRIVSETPEAIFSKTLWTRKNALHLASSRGQTLQLATILHGANTLLDDRKFYAFLNEPDARGNTALLLASKGGHTSCVRILLEEGGNPLVANRRRDTALHLAAHRAHSAVCYLLLTSRVRLPEGGMARAAGVLVPDLVGDERYIDTHNKSGFAPIHLATLSGDSETVSILLQQGASLDSPILRSPIVGNYPYLCGGSTALHIAAGQGSVDICRILLEAQRRHPTHDLRRIRNMVGLTPLNMALLSGHTEVVRALLSSVRSSRDGPRASVGMRAIFPPALRQQMLVLMDRAALVLQLREIAAAWKAAGLSRPTDSLVAAAPWTLGALSPQRVTQLRALLQREEVYLGEVVAGLEAALRVSPVEEEGAANPASPTAAVAVTNTSTTAPAASQPGSSSGAAATGTSSTNSRLVSSTSGLEAAETSSASFTTAQSTITATNSTNLDAVVDGGEGEISSAQRGAQAVVNAAAAAVAEAEEASAVAEAVSAHDPRLADIQRNAQALSLNPAGAGTPRYGRSNSGGRNRRILTDSSSFGRRRRRIYAIMMELFNGPQGLNRTSTALAAHQAVLNAAQAERNALYGEGGGGDQAAAPSEMITWELESLGDDDTGCQICMDCKEEVKMADCNHAMCFACACKLCCRTSNEPISCPFCRGVIHSFSAVPGARGGGVKKGESSTMMAQEEEKASMHQEAAAGSEGVSQKVGAEDE